MYKAFVSLPLLRDGDYQRELREEVAAARRASITVCLQFDWHVLIPFHGPPPGLEQMVNGQRVSDAHLGYAPFGWTRGWIWAAESMQELVDDIRPEAVLYGDEPHYRDGWGFLNDARDPAVAAYNDTLGIYKEALYGNSSGEIQPSDFKPPFLIIPDTGNSNVQQQGIRKANSWVSPQTEVLEEQEVFWQELPDSEPPDLPDDEPEPEPDPPDDPPEWNDPRTREMWARAMVMLAKADRGAGFPPSSLWIRKTRKKLKRILNLL